MARFIAFAPRKAKTLLLAAGVCSVSIACLSGCVLSDTITEKVYDTNEDSSVDQTVQPLLVNSLDADKTSDQLPTLQNNPNSKTKTQTDQNLPVYTTDESKATTNTPANKTKYKKGAGNNGETGSSVSSAADANTRQNASTQHKQEQNKEGVKDKSDNKGQDKKGSQKNKNSKKNKPKDKGESKKPGENKNHSNKSGRTSGGTGTRWTSDEGKDPDIPQNIDEVAAVGNYAVIVAMLSKDASKQTLLACDEDMKSQTQTMLKSTVSKAKALWKSDGADTGDLSSANLKALTNDVVPDLVFVGEDDDTLSSDQIKALEKKNIDVYYLPALTSAKRIKFAVKTIGAILDAGGVKGAAYTASEYLEFHDELVSKYSGKAGGVAGGFDFDTGKKATEAQNYQVTLCIDGWDSKARNSATTFLDCSKGVALSTLGYGDTPVNYYLSEGGVLNNACSSTLRKKDGQAIVWQFAKNQAPFSESDWGKTLSQSITDITKVGSGDTFGACLTYHKLQGLSGFGLGTQRFKTVVAKTGDISKKLEQSSAKSGQLYYSYPTIKIDGSGSTIGMFTDSSKSHYVESSIGVSRSDDSAQVKGGYQVLVNPKGLCQKKSTSSLCSWMDGSVESVLETSWAYNVLYGSSKSDFEQDVKDFYQKFYGCSLSDAQLKSIEQGVSK